MIKRPSSKDSENDILQMQQDFYAESNRDAAFQPAAKVVRMKQPEGAEKAAPVRQSEFARRRKLQKETGAAGVKTVEKKEEVPEHTIIGEIVEKRYDGGVVPMDVGGEGEEGAFPKVVHVKPLPAGGGTGKKSLFAQMFGKGGSGEDSKKVKFQLPSQSVILEGEESKEIHAENLQKMGQMSEEEILKEREHLMGTMDPKLVEFLKARKKGKVPEEKPKPEPIPEVEELKPDLPDLDVLQQEGSDQWINFDILESEKLQWTKDIQKTVKNLKPGENFEARFDWKGTLQPYVNPQQTPEKDDRELYLHGEDADRPGYTLQELFRLARANVLQQRISALNAIAGILNIFNQGFYDGVLELPISKIFFFLRFALDENTPAVVEAASRALANLFYNDTDETLLDTLCDTERGLYQPEMGLNVTHSRSEEEEKERQRELESGFNAMKLSNAGQSKSKKPAQVHFSAHVDDDPDDLTNRESMNDYHLAETDLLECLARTNIVERIRYVLFSMRPEGTTAVSCVKLLIRLARTNAAIAGKIASNEQLMGGLVRVYLGKGLDEAQGKHEPQHVVVKLLRVLCAYGGGIYERHLERHHVVSLLKRYVFSRRDINVKLIQVQIETFRFLRMILKLNRNDALYCELLPALCYLLEWHFQHLAPDGSGPFIIRQHGAALLALIGYDHLAGVPNLGAVLTPQALDRLFACFSKWFNAATKYGVDEFSQKLLLGACLSVATKMRHLAGSYYRSFVDGYLLVFLRSAKFEELMKQLRFSPLASPAGHGATVDRSSKIGPLPNLGGILTSDANGGHSTPPPPSLILAKSYPIFLLHPLLQLLRHHAVDHGPAPLEQFTRHPCQLNYLASLTAPVMAVPSGTVAGLGSNWFLKAELYYILDVLSVSVEHWRRRRHDEDPDEEGALLLALAFRVVLHLSDEFYPAVGKLFDEVLFVREFYRWQSETEVVTAEEMQRWKFCYKMFVDRIRRTKGLSTTPSRNTFTIGSAWRTPLLPTTWPYSPLYLLLEQLEQGLPKPGENQVAEEVLIPLTLKFSELAEANSVRFVTATQKLMYLMVAFLGPDSRFLEPDLSALVTRRIDGLRRDAAQFDFDTRLEERKSFHGLYQLLLDVFQSSSYGHAPFSALVMAPLAQQYDIQWRNLVWSEHVAVLRFITCSEQQLFGSLAEYLEPVETDVTLIKFYSQALHSNLLRPGSIPARIASHHVQAYRQRSANHGTTQGSAEEANDK
ncbi:RNA polymerase II-associated protein 1 [Culex quinquefasciatus]|uniref:RNA polymerase II-associated protein 1 n=1 Tax=Culex quinquefasciatus TaxID=7176 RepID=UPI0018E3BC95|nr:RNA polymerase II-associated protein 1 [Culex quinquefasciatus]